MKIFEVELGAVVKTVAAVGVEQVAEAVLVAQLHEAAAQLQVELQWWRCVAGQLAPRLDAPEIALARQYRGDRWTETIPSAIAANFL